MKTQLGFSCLQGPTGIGSLLSAGSRMMIGVDEIGVLDEAEQKQPGSTQIARFFIPDIRAESMRQDNPESAAHWYISQFQSKIDANKKTLQRKNVWLQGCNESVYKHDDNTDDIEGLQWLARFEAERIKILASQGIQAAVFAFSTGYPRIDSWTKALLIVLPVMRQYKSVLLIHGYSVINMAQDTDNTNRHELIYDQVLVPNGYQDIPFVYGEWAANYWKTIPGLTEDVYMQWFRDGDARLKRFKGNLLGAACYTLGGSDDWKDFRLDGGMVPKLVSYIQSQADTPETPAPIPTPIQSALLNLAFQSSAWRNTANGQEPDKWIVTGYQPSDTLPISQHLMNGQLVPVQLQALPQLVHKLSSQLPTNEQNGQVRSLLIKSPFGYPDKVLKVFNSAEAQAVSLSQSVKLKPNQKYKFSILLLAECTDKAPEQLESDHFNLKIMCNTSLPVFAQWGDMYKQHFFADNERAYNLISMNALADVLGNANISMFMLKNFFGNLCVFIAYTLLEPIEEPTVTQLEGIDVSKFQGQVNWIQVKQQKAFSITRFSFGTEIDPKFQANWDAIKQAGMTRGVYQFFRPSQSAAWQAQLLINSLKEYSAGDIPPILDIERDEGVTNTELALRVQVWIDTIKSKLGVTPLIYTAQSFWDTHVLPNFGVSLWVANYGVTNPHLPKAWKDIGYKFWQYNNQGNASGIIGAVDLDRYNGSLNDLKDWLATLAPVVPSVSTKFKIGDRVKVSTVALNTRVSPAGQVNGTHVQGDTGMIVSGPVVANLATIPVIWWQVNWDLHSDGWSSGGTIGNEKYLELA